MHVDPVKPKLKAPGTKLLKLAHEKLLSKFASNVNLHHYTEDAMVDASYKFRAWRRGRRGKGWQGHVRVRVRLAQLQPLYRWYLRQAGGGLQNKILHRR